MEELIIFAKAFLTDKYPDVIFDVNSRKQVVVYHAVMHYHGLVLDFSDGENNLDGLSDRGYCAYSVGSHDECMELINYYMFPAGKTIQFSERTVYELNTEVGVLFGISPFALRREGRTRPVSQARQLAMFILKRKFFLGKEGVTLKLIAKEYGKTHATVIHAIKSVENLVEFNAPYRDLTANILSKYGINVPKTLIKR